LIIFLIFKKHKNQIINIFVYNNNLFIINYFLKMSSIHYDPPSQQSAYRTVFKIPKGVHVIPGTIKVLDIKVNPTGAGGAPSTAYYPALAGVYSTVKMVELFVGGKPVDIYQSKQASAFINSLGNQDMQQCIASQLSSSSNNIVENVDNDSNADILTINQNLNYVAIDSVPASLDLKKMVDYLANRYICDEGIDVIITWDSDFASYCLNSAPAVTAVNIVPGFISYETVSDEAAKLYPAQDKVLYRQTIEEQIVVPEITDEQGINYLQQIQYRLNSLRAKTVLRSLIVTVPSDTPANTAAVRGTYGKLCSIGQLSSVYQLTVDGQTILTYKGSATPAHSLAMTQQSWGNSSSSVSSWFLPRVPTLVDATDEELSNYYGYFGVNMGRYVDKEVVLEFSRRSSSVADNVGYEAQVAKLQLLMISQVVRMHDVKTGVISYPKM
jgi:hypothetical protein